MKKRFLILATVVVGLGLTACSVDTSGLDEAADKLEQSMDDASDDIDTETDKVADSETPTNLTYQCPDDCDNGPVYDVAGPCDKCGKDMVIF